MNTDVRLLHTADTHIGYRQYHNDIRRQDFIDAFSTVVSDAIEMEIDAVIHAGDLFDSRNPTLDDILDTIEILSRLKIAGIPFLAIVGNHESKQHTQWLDLFESMGIATRLGSYPHRIRDVSIYGIDSVPRSKIPLFDPSVLQPPAEDSVYNILVMHQLMTPFPFGEWDSEELIQSLPFRMDAILLGDYHKYEKERIGDTWITYCGSTERNSASERETRSYNILTLNNRGIDIGRRNIPTRDFEFIKATLSEGDNAYEEIFNIIKEHDVAQKVVFLEISGDPDISISYSEIEEFLLKHNVLVPRIVDARSRDAETCEEVMEVSFFDPEEAVKNEIKGMELTTGGLMVDEIVRNPAIPKTKVDTEAEMQVGELIGSMDFTQPPQYIVAPSARPGAVDEAVRGYVEKKDASGIRDVDEKTGASTIRERAITKDTPANKHQKYEPEIIPDSDTDEATAETIKKPKQYNLGDYL
ncbi:MAG: exonuclease SbcCD subunit D [Euryarchaeota archaeon]|nr:exonuclease SbcCD subunit D [Euryarchaeota archaeon]